MSTAHPTMLAYEARCYRPLMDATADRSSLSEAARSRLAHLEAGGSLDLLDGAMYVDGTYETYQWMRANSPVHWDDTNELWGIFRYDDIVEIERRKDVFSNADQTKGGYRPNLPADPSIIGFDDPLHAKRRALVARWFTPKAMNEWADHVHDVVVELMDAMVAKGGEVEVISDLASPLPAKMIGRLLGFGEQRWRDLARWSETTIALGGGPRYANDEGVVAVFEFVGACTELYEQRKGCPAHDVMSMWTTADIDGVPITLDDVISDCLLLLDGGAETTRTVIARTIWNLIRFPEQWERLKAGADLTTAVEEFIRFVTPVHNMCRVALEDYDLHGTTIRAGQQVVLMYGSANRDEAHFTNPEAFDITRTPNQHIAFGFGTHFCLGTSLARLEIRTFFDELLKRVSGMRITPGTAPVEMANSFVFGVKEAHVQFDLIDA